MDMIKFNEWWNKNNKSPFNADTYELCKKLFEEKEEFINKIGSENIALETERCKYLMENEWNSTAESKFPNDFEHVLGCYVWKYPNGKIEYAYYTVYCWEDKYYDVDGSRRFWKDIDGDEADEPNYWKRENPPKIEEN